jgi:hypothetical protein
MTAPNYTKLIITPNIELNPWADLKDGAPYPGGVIERIGLLPNGTAKGRPTVAMVIRMEDGTVVVAETTWVLFNGAARALAASPVAELDRAEHGS